MDNLQSNTKSPYRKLVYLVIFLLLIVSWIRIQPYLTSYKTRQILKGTCNRIIKLSTRGDRKLDDLDEQDWLSPFLTKVQNKGIVIENSEQYLFKLYREDSHIVCNAKFAFELHNDWGTIATYATFLKPWTTLHRHDYILKIKLKY